MDEPARIFLNMDTGKRDLPLLAVISFNLDISSFCQRLVVLRDLVGLVEVRIEVILSRELGLGNDRAVERLCHPHRIFDCAPVQAGIVPGRPRQTGQTWVLWPSSR